MPAYLWIPLLRQVHRGNYVEHIVIASRLSALFDIVVRLRKGAADIKGVVLLGPLSSKNGGYGQLVGIHPTGCAGIRAFEELFACVLLKERLVADWPVEVVDH